MALFDDFMNQYLSQRQNIQAGRMTPNQLPEYKYLSSDLTNQFQKNFAELMRSINAGQITGGSANKLISDFQEQSAKTNLGAERQAWESASIGGQDIAKFLKQLQVQMDEAAANRSIATAEASANRQQDWLKQLSNVGLAKRGQDLQRDVAKTSSMSQNSQAWQTMGGQQGAGCCFIFIEGHRLTDNVRILRDQIFPKGGSVEMGYRKMAKWLVPLMARNRFVKEIVRFIMLDPICIISDCYCGKNSWGYLLRPIGDFWRFVWERMGEKCEGKDSSRK